jgi:broad specificity phosphatase PhoE
MRVLFLRHGESLHNVHTGEERLAEELDDLLTERGRAQAAAAGAALRDQGITHLFTSPIPYAFEHHREVTFEVAMGRVHQVKRHFEDDPVDGVPLLVSHGILLRFFLLDSILGARFTADLVPRMWGLRTFNCALSTFTHDEPGEPDESLDWSCVTWMARPWDLP